MSYAFDNCPECDKLSAEYESATIRWFRLESQKRIAEFGLDREASQRIASEMAAVDAQRERLKQALHLHIAQRHAESARAA